MKKFLAVLLTGIFIALLTGIHYTIENSIPIVNLVVGITYFLGSFSLYLMYKSCLSPNPKNRHLMFFVGIFGVVLAYYSLEILLRLGIR